MSEQAFISSAQAAMREVHARCKATFPNEHFLSPHLWIGMDGDIEITLYLRRDLYLKGRGKTIDEAKAAILSEIDDNDPALIAKWFEVIPAETAA